MASCELCGKQGNLISAKVEGVTMSVCSGCSRFGTIITAPRKIFQKIKAKQSLPESTESLVNNWNVILKQRREKLSLTQEQLAKRLAEKESLVQKLENEKIEPNIELTKKLEKILRVKLLVIVEEERVSQKSSSNNMTIGDILKKKSF